MPSAAKTKTSKDSFTAYYPSLKAENNTHPNRLYAFPLFGILIKLIMLIPALFVLIFIGIVSGLATWFNALYVLFTGKYWEVAYHYHLKAMRYILKITYFVSGLTDKYPGFNFEIDDHFSVDMPMPQHPNRLYAIPILGIVIRMVLMIPYFIWVNILQNGAGVGTAVSSIPVLFSGKYPESTYEFNRDTSRVYMANYAYLAGLSDKYPSFSISMNHKAIKIILIIIGIILLFTRSHSFPRNTNYQYQNSPPAYNLPK